MKKPKQADRERCRECPLWAPTVGSDGSDVNAPVLDDKGERVMRNGIPQLWKHQDGELVRWGVCGANLPEQHVLTVGDRLQRTITSLRETRSDWFCESKEKHEAIHRLGLVKLR